MAIPTVLIPALRSALTSQGFPAGTITDDGRLNPAGLLAGSYDSVEFRTAFTPNILVDTRGLVGAPGVKPEANAFVKLLKPAVIMRGRAGESIIAPYGVPDEGGWAVPVAAVGFLMGVGFLLGRATAR